MLTELVAMFGAKFCCIAAAGTGGVCNAAVRRKTPVRDILLLFVDILVYGLCLSWKELF